MLAKIISIVFYNIIESIYRWLTQKKMEQLESQVAAANATIVSIHQSSQTEDEIKKAQHDLDTKLNELNSYKSKLEAINNYNRKNLNNSIKNICIVIIVCLLSVGCFVRLVPVKNIAPIINIPEKPTINVPKFNTDNNGEPILTENEKALIDSLTILINDNEKLRESIRIYNESATKNNDEIYQTLQMEKIRQKWIIPLR